MIKLTVFMILIGVSSACLGSSHAVSRASFTAQVPAPEADVLAAVVAVTSDAVIHGTYQFEKERTLTGAKAVELSPFFGRWDGAGKAFYKVADGVLSPVGFKESADIGTITVRYVVQPLDASDTTVTIDAVFVESAHRAVHSSEGVVESAEYSAIREQLEKIEAERRKAKQEEQRISAERTDATLARDKSSDRARVSVAPLSVAPGSTVASGSAIEELEQQVATLRRMVQTRIRVSGTQLKAAPYKSAATLTSLPLNTDVVVLILSRYWYGVETADGHRGWVHRDQVEALP